MKEQGLTYRIEAGPIFHHNISLLLLGGLFKLHIHKRPTAPRHATHDEYGVCYCDLIVEAAGHVMNVQCSCKRRETVGTGLGLRKVCHVVIIHSTKERLCIGVTDRVATIKLLLLYMVISQRQSLKQQFRS